MNTLLIFFALPLATIILAIVLQKLIKCPILVAAIFFAIYLIVAFAVFNATFLIAVIVYTFLAYVTAAIVKILCCFFSNCNWSLNCSCSARENNCSCRNNTNMANNNVISLNDANGSVRVLNNNECNCRLTCTNGNSTVFNNGYNRGYNNGYDNGYNNAVDFLNDNSRIGCNGNGITTISNNNNNCCCCRRRCR